MLYCMSYYVPKTSTRVIVRLIDSCWAGPLLFLFFDKSPLHYFSQGWVPLRNIIFYIITLIVCHVLFLKFKGASPGKWILGLKVVPYRPESRDLTWSQASVRVLSSMMLGFLFSWAPYVLALMRFDRTHLVDWIAETRVVGLKKRPTQVVIYPKLAVVVFLFFALMGLGQAQNQIMLIDFHKSKILIKF